MADRSVDTDSRSVIESVAKQSIDGENPSGEDFADKPPRQALPATPPQEGNSDSAIAADEPEADISTLESQEEDAISALDIDVTVNNQVDFIAAINSASNGVNKTIAISTGFTINTQIPINANKIITITSANPDDIQTLTRDNSFNGNLFYLATASSPAIPAKFTLENIIIDGGNRDNTVTGVLIRALTSTVVTIANGAILQNNITSDNGAAIQTVGTVNVLSGATLQNNSSNGSTSSGLGYGGAIYGNTASIINIYGTIDNNHSRTGGGGIFSNASATSLSIFDGAVITNNETSGHGGGISILNNGFTLSGNFLIDSNTAGTTGGGINVGQNSTFTMNSGTISSNEAANSGGGIYIPNNVVATISGGSIKNNTSGTDGGGIGIAYTNLANLNVASGVVFSGNTAASYALGVVAGDLATYNAHIEKANGTWSKVPASERSFLRGYNNYDISYLKELPKYKVEFLAGTNGSLDGIESYENIYEGTVWDDADIVVPDTVPANSHYSFTEWTDSIPDGSSFVINENSSYTANFKIDSHTVTYNGNGHTGGILPEKGTYTHGNTVSGVAPNLFRDGYTLIGWAEKASETTAKFPLSFSIENISRDYTLYAIWKPINYTVKYLPGTHGTFAEQVTGGLHYSDGVAPNTPAAPKTTGEAGWEFDGWDKAISSKVTGNATYTAVWKAIDYTVKYLPGTHGTFAEQVTGGLHYSDITPAAPSVSGQNGWKFDGWDRAIASEVTGNAVYTAMWSEVSVTPPADDDTAEISYVDGGEGVTGIPSGSTVRIGERYTIPSVSPSRDGYTFGGWTVTVGGVSRTYRAGDSFVVRGDTVLVAIWTEVAATPTPTLTVSKAEDPIESTPEPEAAVNQAMVVSAAAAAGIPILPGGVPLYGPAGFDTWALLDLILAIAGVILLLFTLVMYIRKSRREEAAEENYYGDEEDEHRRNRRPLWLVITVILAIVAVVLFVITQDMRLPMVFVDGWTIVFAILFVVEVIASKFTSKRVQQDEEEDRVA